MWYRMYVGYHILCCMPRVMFLPRVRHTPPLLHLVCVVAHLSFSRLCREGLTQNKPALWHNLRERLAREVPATMHGEWTAHFDPMIDVDAASMRMDVMRWGEFRLSSAAPRTIRLGLGLGLGRAY